MIKIKSKAVFLSLLFLCFSFDAFSSEVEQLGWPLNVLIFPEREARLDFFIEHKDLEFYPEVSTANETTCMANFEKLKQGEYTVLSPKHVFREKEQGEESLFQCPDLNIDTIYIPPEANENYKFKSTPVYNREYYDFSRILKQNIWGFFAEGGVVECRAETQEEWCDNITGYKRGSYTAGTVFNADTCDILLGPDFVVNSRISPSQYSDELYRQNPSFYAFVQIDKSIHRLAFNIEDKWEDFRRVLQPETASLLFINVVNNEKCGFFTHNLKRERDK
ncbi:MAG: hypothetical protein ACQEQL_03070 [Pseudomonadota bacterium]